MRLLPTGLLAVAATLAIAPAASADSVFDAPRTLATGAQETVVAMGPKGDAAIGWAGTGGGVYVVRRSPDGRFSPAETVSTETAHGLLLRRSARGDLALAWQRGTVDDQSSPVRVAIAAPGAAFSAPASPPDLPGSRALYSNVRDHPGGAWGAELSLAAAADGSATVVYNSLDGRTLAATATPGDGFSPVHVLGEGDTLGNPVAAAGPSGAVTAAWEARTPGAVEGMDSVFEAVRAPDGTWSPRRAISDPALDAGSGTTDPTIAVGPHDEAIVAWAAMAPPQGGMFNLFPDRTEVAERDADGTWGAARRLGALSDFRVVLAFNGRGDAVASGTFDTTFRPAGASFGPTRTSPVSAGIYPGGGPPPYPDGSPVALDGLGISVQVVGKNRRIAGGPGYAVRAAVREGSSPFAQAFTVTQPGELGEWPDVATDDRGQGLIVWTNPDSGRLRFAQYRAAAPSVGTVRVGRSAFTFASNRTAFVRVAVRGRRGRRVREVAQTAVLRPALNVVPFSPPVKRLLRRKGRYTITVRSADRGPRQGVSTLRFRRR